MDGSKSDNLTDVLFTQTDSQVLGLSLYYLVLPVILYPTLVALLRKHRLRQTLEAFPYTNRRSFASMTNEDAFYINQIIGELEFPFIFEKALQFALFRTYGIPSISKLLVQTGLFSEESTATKRYTDTVVLIAEFMGYHPVNTRSIKAIGRMNYIHNQYQKSGRILDDDMLYTLSLFAGEPVRWIDTYEWRKLEDFEKCAIGAFWKAIGDAMGIGYGPLKSGREGGEGWRDGLQWLEEIVEWSAGYEERAMVADEYNRKTAEQTVAILLWNVPSWLKPYGVGMVSALMDDRLRKAMIYEKPPEVYFTLVRVMFEVRKFFLRHLSLPRPYILRNHVTTEQPSKDGTYHMTAWVSAPWYIRPTLWNRYGPPSWLGWLLHLPVPGDGGEKYSPQGYNISEIGPNSMKGKGANYIRESKERLIGERTKRCPFGRAKKE